MLANLIERTRGVLTGGPAPQPVAPTANDTYRAARDKLAAAQSQLSQVQAKLPELAADRDCAFAALAGASEVRTAADTAEALLKAGQDAAEELRGRIEARSIDASGTPGMAKAAREAREIAAAEAFDSLAAKIADKIKPLAPDLARLYALGLLSGHVSRQPRQGPSPFIGNRQIFGDEDRWLTVFAAVTQPLEDDALDALTADDAALGIG